MPTSVSPAKRKFSPAATDRSRIAFAFAASVRMRSVSKY
jgi:hypothetical protein